MRALTLALLLVTSTAGVLPAATYHLNAEGSGDFPTIVAAIAAADPGDSILLAAGLYLGAGNTQLDYGGKDIVIAGAGPGATILDCMDSGVMAVRFRNGESRDAVLGGMTLQNNLDRYSPMGIVIEGASPTLANLELRRFDAPWSDMWPNYYNGAAIHCTDGSPLVFEVEIRDCMNAGAVYLSGGAPDFERVLIEDCTVMLWNAGGLELRSTAAQLREVVVRGCEAYGANAGGVLCAGAPAPSFEDCRFENNWQGHELPGGWWYGGGGGGMLCDGASPTLRRCSFVGNDARDGGGGLACIEGAAPLLEDVLMADNGSAGGGSAMLVIESAPTLRGVTITASRFDDLFGHEVGIPSAIYCMNGAPTLERVIVASNAVGTGLYTETGGEAVISCSDFYANPDGNYGGLLGDQTGSNGNISADPLFCDAPGGDYTLDASSPCLPGGNDCGVQMGAFGWGCGVTAAQETAPAAFTFAPPQPNPFNPKTTLHFALPRAAVVDLVIFDVTGRRVARLLAGEPLPAGNHAVDWNGRDEAGDALASGVYFARFSAGGFTEERKLVLLR